MCNLDEMRICRKEIEESIDLDYRKQFIRSINGKI